MQGLPDLAESISKAAGSLVAKSRTSKNTVLGSLGARARLVPLPRAYGLDQVVYIYFYTQLPTLSNSKLATGRGEAESKFERLDDFHEMD